MTIIDGSMTSNNSFPFIPGISIAIKSKYGFLSKAKDTILLNYKNNLLTDKNCQCGKLHLYCNLK